MTNIDHAENIIYEAITGDGFSAPELRTRHAARALANAGLLAPEPRVIRTRDELAALDPDTVLINIDAPQCELRMNAREWMDDYAIDAEGIFPLAAIATGEQVRAAQRALKEEE